MQRPEERKHFSHAEIFNLKKILDEGIVTI